MSNRKLVLSTGLAMFSMFFGSGNLVFPLVVGQLSQGHYLLATLGFFATAVLVPFLGILGMLLFKGDTHSFLSRLGRYAPFWFSLIALSLMGPFGVLARCITVAHGSFTLLLPSTPLWAFSLTSCALLFLLTFRQNRIVPLLGTTLTPLLLLALGAIAYFGLTSHPLPSALPGTSLATLTTSLLKGYQTMDLLAAFFFSNFVIRHLQQDDPRASLSIFFRASLLGAGLLSLVYFFLILAGAMYAPELASVPPQEMFGYVAQITLGPLAAPLVAAAVILACVTTAVVLSTLFAEFVQTHLYPLSRPLSLLLTLAIAFSTSILGFSQIAQYLGFFLEMTYPALILLTLLNIGYRLYGWKAVRVPTALAIATKLLSSI